MRDCEGVCAPFRNESSGTAFGGLMHTLPSPRWAQESN